MSAYDLVLYILLGLIIVLGLVNLILFIVKSIKEVN